jgi:hypothetical protein
MGFQGFLQLPSSPCSKSPALAWTTFKPWDNWLFHPSPSLGWRLHSRCQVPKHHFHLHNFFHFLNLKIEKILFLFLNSINYASFPKALTKFTKFQRKLSTSWHDPKIFQFLGKLSLCHILPLNGVASPQTSLSTNEFKGLLCVNHSQT